LFVKGYEAIIGICITVYKLYADNGFISIYLIFKGYEAVIGLFFQVVLIASFVQEPASPVHWYL
jgi:hypothetical protein